MKIDRIDTFPVTAQIIPARAIRSSAGLHDRSPFLFVRLRTSDGIDGIGEASCTLAWSGEDHVTVEHVIRQVFESLLMGADASRIEWLTGQLDRAVPGHIFAKAAIEMALWDIAGKAAGLPVYRLLGGRVRDRIRTKFSISGAPPDEAATIAAWAMEAGFRAVKVKVGRDPDEDGQRVKAVRAAIGADVLLGVDANGGWSQSDAIRTIRKLEEFGIAFAEQPILAGDPAKMAQVRAAVNVPIMADESLFTLSDALGLAKADAVDCFSLYAGKGGLGPARKMASVADAAGIACTVGSNLELGVGAAAQIHLAMATGAIRDDLYPCDILTPFYYEEDFVLEPHPIMAGEASVLEKPGLGVELDEDALMRFRSH